MNAPQMRSPAPRANAVNRAEVTRNEISHTIPASEPEADFAVAFIAWRYCLTAPHARVVVMLAGLGAFA